MQYFFIFHYLLPFIVIIKASYFGTYLGSSKFKDFKFLTFINLAAYLKTLYDSVGKSSQILKISPGVYLFKLCNSSCNISNVDLRRNDPL